MTNGPMILDLLHPVDSVLQFPTMGRVGDAGVQIPLWIKSDGKPFNLMDYEVGFYGKNANGLIKITHEKPEGQSVQSGRITFTLPGELFRAAGEYEEAWFKILKDGQAVSSLSVKFNVLENNVEFNLPDEPYISDFERIKNHLTDEATKYLKDWTAKFSDLEELEGKLQTTVDELKKQIEAGNIITKDDLANALKGYVKTEDFETYKDEADVKYLASNVDVISESTDWNTAIKSGIYQVKAAKGTNSPISDKATYGNLFVIANDGYIEQHYFSATESAEYTRSYSGTSPTWSEWQEFVTTQELRDSLIKTFELKAVNGAVDNAYLTVINEKFITLNINSKIPKSAGNIYYTVPSNYVPKKDTPLTMGHNTMSSQAVLVITVKGDVVITNDDDQKAVFGSFSYSI